MVGSHTVQKFKVKTVELQNGLRLGSKIANGIIAYAEKTLPKMVGMTFLASKMQEDSLYIQI